METTPLWNADTAPEEAWITVGQFEYDTQNQIEGAGCIGITFGNGPYFDATFPVSAADTANMSALEFDLYISDLAILDCLSNTRAAIQLSPVSNSKVSDGTLNYNLTHVAKELIAKGATVGWNHVVILLEYMANPTVFGTEDHLLDLSNIDSLRIFLMNIQNADPNWELKFDNFVLTNRRGSAPGYHDPSEGYFSCGADGHSAKCGNCGEYVGNMNPHVFDGWIVRQAPTETEDGLQYRECMMCDYSETQSIPKTGSQITDDDDTNKQNQQNTTDTTDDSAPGCSGAIGGAWSIPAVLSLAGWAIRKKQK